MPSGHQGGTQWAPRGHPVGTKGGKSVPWRGPGGQPQSHGSKVPYHTATAPSWDGTPCHYPRLSPPPKRELRAITSPQGVRMDCGRVDTLCRGESLGPEANPGEGQPRRRPPPPPPPPVPGVTGMVAGICSRCPPPPPLPSDPASRASAPAPVGRRQSTHRRSRRGGPRTLHDVLVLLVHVDGRLRVGHGQVTRVVRGLCRCGGLRPLP